LVVEGSAGEGSVRPCPIFHGKYVHVNSRLPPVPSDIQRTHLPMIVATAAITREQAFT
jgi:hypothetical protein